MIPYKKGCPAADDSSQSTSMFQDVGHLVSYDQKLIRLRYPGDAYGLQERRTLGQPDRRRPHRIPLHTLCPSAGKLILSTLLLGSAFLI